MHTGTTVRLTSAKLNDLNQLKANLNQVKANLNDLRLSLNRRYLYTAELQAIRHLSNRRDNTTPPWAEWHQTLAKEVCNGK